MDLNHSNLIFKLLSKDDQVPYDLLLLADPAKHLVDEYLKLSEVFTVSLNEEVIGVIVLFPLSQDTVEIKNVAVKEAFQGKGIGSFLIEQAVKLATAKNLKSISIGTANSSIGQLYLYQKLGFEISDIKKDFFTENYPKPIFENGIQAKHMLILIKVLG